MYGRLDQIPIVYVSPFGITYTAEQCNIYWYLNIKIIFLWLLILNIVCVLWMLGNAWYYMALLYSRP